MNIAVFAKKTVFHAGYGGMEVQNKLLAEGLVKKGHSVTVFTPKIGTDLTTREENGVKYTFVESEYRYFLSEKRSKSWYNRSYEVFKKEHSSAPFDVVISQSSAGAGIITRKEELRVKVISIAHGSALGELKTYFINHHSLFDLPKLIINSQYSMRQFFGRQRSFVLHSDKVIAVSNAVKRQLEDETFPPENLITVINNGIQPFEITNVQRFTKKLIFAGQVTKDKGADLMLKLIKDVRFKDYELDVVGDGDLMPIFKRVSVESDNVVRFRLHGKLSNEDTISIFKQNAGAVFVFPTKRVEGFPMVLVEAMFAELPVVAYDLGGVSDAVKDEITGILVPFQKQDVFINKLLALAEDPVKMDHMGKTARKYAEENFTIQTMLSKYEEVIEEVLKK